jgi:hypothetical protein
MTSSPLQSHVDGELGPYPNASWMTAFAERLLQLKPESTPLDAVRVAMQQSEPSVALGPAHAAEIYAMESGPGESGFD